MHFNVLQCDWCGARQDYREQLPRGWGVFHLRTYGGEAANWNVDLCPDCNKAIRAAGIKTRAGCQRPTEQPRASDKPDASALKLTKAQLAELERLGQKRQPLFGPARARVQGNLAAKGLAQFVDARGVQRTICDGDAARCVITDRGREVLRTFNKRRTT